MPEWGLGLIAVGGLWLALWRLPWRAAGAVVLAGGLASLLFARPPDLVVAGDARAFAVLGATGSLVIRGDAGRFTRETWLRRAGYGASGADGEASALACDPQACVYRIGRTRISLIRDPGAAREDCHRADVVVALVPLRRIRCQGPSLVIGRFDLWREGAHALWVGPDGDIRLETAAEARGRRPWVPRRGGRR
jgi:competence protein ComEC